MTVVFFMHNKCFLFCEFLSTFLTCVPYTKMFAVFVFLQAITLHILLATLFTLVFSVLDTFMQWAHVIIQIFSLCKFSYYSVIQRECVHKSSCGDINLEFSFLAVAAFSLFVPHPGPVIDQPRLFNRPYNYDTNTMFNANTMWIQYWGTKRLFGQKQGKRWIET